MHPAYSVIVFTTVSGAGYGLLIWLSLFGGLQLLSGGIAFGLIAFGLALGMISVGLLSSTLHLGHPERAWRAFSQWRSSWLSREGVAAVFTYIPAALFAIAWIFYEADSSLWMLVALLTITAALITVYCTGMIYASLRTIRHWNHPMVPIVYIVLALATGALLLNLLLFIFGQSKSLAVWSAILFLVAGCALKNYYWKSVDSDEGDYTAGSAIGLGKATVRPLDPPHSQPNYVMREMGFTVARKHAAKLRLLTNVFCFGIPIILLLLTLVLGNTMGLISSLLATLSAALGIVIERWLFFAEAQHVVTLYYGANKA